MADARIAKYEKLCCILIDALQMYANPEFYHGIMIIPDRPAGGFDEDVSSVKKLGFDYNRPMPGKLARTALRKAEKVASTLTLAKGNTP